MLKIQTILLIALLAFQTPTFGQSKNVFTNTKVTVNCYADTLPFEFVKNKILVEVMISGEKKKYFFDTGAPLIISPSTQEKYSYKPLPEKEMHDINDAKKMTPFVVVPEITLGKTVFKNNTAGVQDLGPIMGNCLGIDGIIGSNLLKGVTVKIDVKAKHLIITKQKNFFKEEEGQATLLKTDDQNTPIITISPFTNATEELIFDTGDDDMYSPKIDNFIHFHRELDLSRQILFTGNGAASIGIFGNEQDFVKFLLKLSDLKINQVQFNNVYAVTTFGRNSRIGAELLNYGTVILNFIKHKFSFTPYEGQTNPISMTDPIPDFQCMPENGRLMIGLIWEESVAYKAGLRKGFALTQINDYVIGDDMCEVFFKLSDERKKKSIKIKALDLEGKEAEYSLEYE